MLQEFWAWLTSSAGEGVGVLLHICGTALAVGGATYGWFRRRLRHSGAVIARLQEDLARRTEQLDRSSQKEKQLEASCAEATGRLAETALAGAQKWWRDDNYNRGNRVLAEWLEREGEPISKLLVRRAEWAGAHAAGDLGVTGRFVQNCTLSGLG
jgi:hypothetical protein